MHGVTADRNLLSLPLSCDEPYGWFVQRPPPPSLRATSPVTGEDPGRATAKSRILPCEAGEREHEVGGGALTSWRFQAATPWRPRLKPRAGEYPTPIALLTACNFTQGPKSPATFYPPARDLLDNGSDAIGGRMDWNRAIGEERAALERMIALLLALADLAELARCRGASAGRLLLSILRPAEAAIREFLDGESDTTPATAGRSGEIGEELACLAARLRHIAAILACWARLACPSSSRRCKSSLPNPAGFMRGRRAAGGSGVVRPAHVDTS